ncbi:FeoB-associated Cys-rich membrane protein [Parapedobacter sp. DT-150]|uniref:FeoB-associated Cys-rich membrane protein n=1 Tax=Parapedobacter sp. DT-150 TaxID=3396162 RepID=UPI003F1A0810
MEINYMIVALVLLGVIILVIWLIRRNQKDKKELERKLNLSDLEPEKHSEDDL